MVRGERREGTKQGEGKECPFPQLTCFPLPLLREKRRGGIKKIEERDTSMVYIGFSLNSF